MRQIIKALLSETQLQVLRGVRDRWRFCRMFGFGHARLSLFKAVPGFLVDQEALTLFDLARGLPGSSPIVVEIGSWLGKSSVVLGHGLREKGSGRLVCIDPFDASGNYVEKARRLSASLQDTFNRNIERAGLSGIVTARRGMSHEVVSTWEAPIDLLFIDGDHAYESVKQDFFDWSPFVKPGGLIAFHDTWFAPPTATTLKYRRGPGRAVGELVVENTAWEQVCHVHSLYVARQIDQRVQTRRNDG